MKTSLQIITALLAIALLSFEGNAYQLEEKGKPDDSILSLQSRIPQMMQQVDVPGLSIAVIRDSKIFLNHGFGITNYTSQNPVTSNTVFEAGSLSKPVFAYAVLKLSDEGLIDLDKSLSTYLPINYVLDDQINQVTARMVLSHTSGFPLWWPEGENLKIYFTPGEKFSYSSEGFVYLQNAVEAITEKSLPIFMKEYAFEPLNMTNSSYVWEDRFEEHMALGHNQFGQEESPWKRNMGNAASSLLTTANDYAHFMMAILNQTDLKSETFEEMLRPQIKLDSNCFECIDNQSGGLSESLSWGLGWGIFHSHDKKLLWHWGDNLRYTSFCILANKHKSGLVYFANGSNGLTLANGIVSTLFGDIHPILEWLRYNDFDSPAVTFRQTVLKEGTEKGLTKYFQLKQNSDAEDSISENSINELGYILLNINRVPEAIDIFRLNVEEHPNSWNVYDSLAEAYSMQGDKQRAINYYNIALKKVKKEEGQKNRIMQILQELQN